MGGCVLYAKHGRLCCNLPCFAYKTQPPDDVQKPRASALWLILILLASHYVTYIFPRSRVHRRLEIGLSPSVLLVESLLPWPRHLLQPIRSNEAHEGGRIRSPQEEDSITSLSTSWICRRLASLKGTFCVVRFAWLSNTYADTEETLLNRNERERLIEEVLDETFGLGPLETLLKDPTISDILINGPKQTYVERRGRMEKANCEFRDNAHLVQIIDRIVSKVGRRCDETSPLVDARLPDGSRVNAVIPPIALDGPSLSIRRFGSNPLKLEDLLNYKAFTPEMVMLLEGVIKARLNVIICGGVPVRVKRRCLIRCRALLGTKNGS